MMSVEIAFPMTFIVAAETDGVNIAAETGASRSAETPGSAIDVETALNTDPDSFSVESAFPIRLIVEACILPELVTSSTTGAESTTDDSGLESTIVTAYTTGTESSLVRPVEITFSAIAHILVSSLCPSLISMNSVISWPGTGTWRRVFNI